MAFNVAHISVFFERLLSSCSLLLRSRRRSRLMRLSSLNLAAANGQSGQSLEIFSEDVLSIFVINLLLSNLSEEAILLIERYME